LVAVASERRPFQKRSAAYVQRCFGTSKCFCDGSGACLSRCWSCIGPGRERVRCATLRAEVREVQRRFPPLVLMRERGCVPNTAEPLPGIVRRHLLVQLHVERHSGLQLQPVLRALQVREHEGRLLHYLHQRRQQVLRHAAGLLRLPGVLLQERLLLLRLLRQYLLLLRHVRSVRKQRRGRFIANVVVGTAHPTTYASHVPQQQQVLPKQT